MDFKKNKNKPTTIVTIITMMLGIGALYDGDLTPSGLVAIALTHAFALFVAVSIAANISGGHVNPAVTFGLAIGGHITILKGLIYWIVQLLGAVVASYLLTFVTNGQVKTRTNYKTLMQKHKVLHDLLIKPNLIIKKPK